MDRTSTAVGIFPGSKQRLWRTVFAVWSLLYARPHRRRRDRRSHWSLATSSLAGNA